MKNQAWRENTHDNNKWLIVSSSRSQRGHFSGWGNPFLASRSAVQHLSCAASHKKNLHLFGAQVFQILSQGLNWVDPMNMASKGSSSVWRISWHLVSQALCFTVTQVLDGSLPFLFFLFENRICIDLFYTSVGFNKFKTECMLHSVGTCASLWSLIHLSL
jgi:hypothetical protein